MRLILALAFLVACAASARAETRVALVVGEAAYQRVGPLPNPARDATAIADLLKSADFSTVRLATDRSRTQLQQELRDFADLAETADIAVFYFAGHGVEISGKNYLVPIDANLRSDLDAEDQAIDLDYVLKRMEGAKKLKLVMLDACRENPFKIKSRGRSIGRGLAPPAGAEGGTLIAFAAQPGAIAADGDGGHSPYAQALLNHIAAPGVELGMALRRVHDEVLRGSGRSRQEPWTNGAIGAEEIYFGSRSKAPAALASPDVQQSEFDAAMSAGTVAALDGFLGKYSTGPLANTARRERERLSHPQLAAVTPGAPVVPRPSGPCGGATLASLSARSPSPLSANEECALAAKAEFQECEKCPKMVVVPAGTFTMGSPKGEKERHDYEGPQHEVTISRPIAVGKFEVSFEEWDACVADGGCGGHRPNDNGWGRGRLPVINVSWDDAQSYVSWLSRKTGKSYRLLSEAEWEYAARGGTTTPYWWGSSISTARANYDGNLYDGGKKGTYRARTVAIDSFAANSFGLYNVHGNVFEWVEDCWNDSYQGAPVDGSAWTTGDCSRRVVRGGSWNIVPMVLRAAYRYGDTPDHRNNGTGLRLARTLHL